MQHTPQTPTPPPRVIGGDPLCVRARPQAGASLWDADASWHARCARWSGSAVVRVGLAQGAQRGIALSNLLSPCVVSNLSLLAFRSFSQLVC